MSCMAPQGEANAERFLLVSSVFASLSYFLCRDMALPQAAEIAWKGAGVGFLALYAARRASTRDGWLLAAVMSLHALSDMVLELDLIAGGALFAAGHAVAIALYFRNRRPGPGGSQTFAAAALLLGTPLVAALLAIPKPGWPLAAVYSVFVGGMAATAWLSRFPRYRTGLGAVLFVASDLLIFAREGERLPEAVTWWLIWPLYYGGQFLIATSVSRALRTGTDRGAPSAR